MIKALMLGVAASLAAVAIAIAPAMSQGAKSTVPVWSGCKELSTGQSKTCQTISWGTLTFKFPTSPEVGSITCKKSDAASISNTSEGGLDETVLMDFYECSSTGSSCHAPAVVAKRLPWNTALKSSGGGTATTIVDEITGIELEITCPDGPVINASGSLKPRMVNGNPLKEEFTSSTGTLASTLGAVEVTGIDKMMGFVDQERLKVKT